MKSRAVKLFALLVFELFYIYWSGYGIGYLAGLNYKHIFTCEFQLVLLVLGILRWLILILIIALWFKISIKNR